MARKDPELIQEFGVILKVLMWISSGRLLFFNVVSIMILFKVQNPSPFNPLSPIIFLDKNLEISLQLGDWHPCASLS